MQMVGTRRTPLSLSLTVGAGTDTECDMYNVAHVVFYFTVFIVNVRLRSCQSKVCQTTEQRSVVQLVSTSYIRYTTVLSPDLCAQLTTSILPSTTYSSVRTLLLRRTSNDYAAVARPRQRSVRNKSLRLARAPHDLDALVALLAQIRVGSYRTALQLSASSTSSNQVEGIGSSEAAAVESLSSRFPLPI